MFNIAICDDNKKDSVKIEAIVKGYMNNKSIPYKINIFKSGTKLLEFHDKIDLIFLDIAMDGINGIQTGKMIREINRNVKIVYTTSYQQYCKKAVNIVHAFAYLEKPVSKEKAEQQLDEILQYNQEEQEKAEIAKFEVIEFTKEGKLGTTIKDFDVKDILYFEYFDRKIKIRLENEEYFFIDIMKDLAEKMREHGFEICHQCFLVNLRHIKKIKGYEVFLDNDEKLSVSQKKSADFRKRLNKFIQSSI
jgi:two-component system, LytTR family, response regulator